MHAASKVYVAILVQLLTYQVANSWRY